MASGNGDQYRNNEIMKWRLMAKMAKAA